MDEIFTLAELAARLQISPRKVRSLVKARVIPCLRLSQKSLRFHWPSVISKLNK